MKLDGNAQGLLDALRAEDTPSTAVADRGWAAISTTLGAEATAAPALASKTGAGLGPWIGGAVVTVGLAVGIGWPAGANDPRQNATVEHSTAPVAVAGASLPEPRPPHPLIAPPTEPPAIAPRPVPPTKPPRSKRRKARSGPRLGPELALMQQARAKLATGDAAAAVRLLSRHAKQFPNGVLARERDVSRIVALCELGRIADAQRRARRYLAKHSGSALAARVRHSCALP